MGAIVHPQYSPIFVARKPSAMGGNIVEQDKLIHTQNGAADATESNAETPEVDTELLAASQSKSEPLPPLRTPSEQRFYNRHLYAEVAWYGVLAGSSLGFVVIYITRLGASTAQLGWINAGPALIALLITLPAGRWLSKQHIGRAMFRMLLVHRIGYASWIILPFVLPPATQINVIIFITLAANVLGTALNIAFNSLYAAAVPPELRGQVAGIRNALLALTLVISSLVSGYILDHMPMQQGYALVFAIGFVGAMMNVYHFISLRRIRGDEGIDPRLVRSTMGEGTRSASPRVIATSGRTGLALRIFARGKLILRPEILRSSFGLMVFALAFFHFAQYIPAPIFPIFWVDELRLSDQQISLGTAFFQACVFAGSFGIGSLTRRKGNMWITVVGIMALSLYPLAVALSTGMTGYLIASIAGGLAWALVGGALGNYVLEMTPPMDRPAYIAWYNLALNAGVLIGSVAGPILAEWFGLREAIFVAFVARLLSAFAVWYAGKRVHEFPPGGAGSVPADAVAKA